MSFVWFQDGYRYVFADMGPHAERSNFELDSWAGKPIPGEIYRVVLPPSVFLALCDRGEWLFRCFPYLSQRWPCGKITQPFIVQGFETHLQTCTLSVKREFGDVWSQ